MTQNKHEMKLREMSDYPSLYPGEQEACIAGADALAALAAPPAPRTLTPAEMVDVIVEDESERPAAEAFVSALAPQPASGKMREHGDGFLCAYALGCVRDMACKDECALLAAAPAPVEPPAPRLPVYQLRDALAPHVSMMQDVGGNWHKAVTAENIVAALASPATPVAMPPECDGCITAGWCEKAGACLAESNAANGHVWTREPRA